MAPKKADAAPSQPQVDTNPYGAFINLDLETANLEFGPLKDQHTDAPKTVLQVVFSPLWAPLATEPVEGGSGSISFAFKNAFRWDASHEGLVSLINASIKLNVYDPEAKCILGSAELDMLDFALGSSGWELKDVQLVVAEQVPETAAYKYNLQDGLPLPLEVARYLTHDSLSDPAWEYYHGSAGLKGFQSLQTPGTTSFSEMGVTLEPFAASERESFMPAYDMPAGKAKPIEESPAPSADGSVPCAWKDAATSLDLVVSFARPVFPPWRPPRKPERSLPELLPSRHIKPHVPPTAAATEFTTLGQSITGGAEKRAKALLGELILSGKDLELQAALRKTSVNVARERFQKPYNAGIGNVPAGPDTVEKQDLQNDLFTFLMGEMNAVLTGMGILPGAEPPSEGAGDTAPLDGSGLLAGDRETAKEVARLVNLAGECEAQGLFSRAEMLHLRCLLASGRTDPNVWVEYGSMLMRAAGEVAAGMGCGGSGYGRAEECFRAALALQPSHKGALLALASVILHAGCFTDPLLLTVAETNLQVKGADGHAAVAWALLWLVYTSRGGPGDAESTKAAEAEILKLEEEFTRLGEAPASASGVYAASKQLLDLGLPALSMKSLAVIDNLTPSSSQLLA
eukprot:gene14250-20223_t